MRVSYILLGLSTWGAYARTGQQGLGEARARGWSHWDISNQEKLSRGFLLEELGNWGNMKYCWLHCVFWTMLKMLSKVFFERFTYSVCFQNSFHSAPAELWYGETFTFAASSASSMPAGSAKSYPEVWEPVGLGFGWVRPLLRCVFNGFNGIRLYLSGLRI